MELYVYDALLNRLGVVEEIASLTWTRRYQTAGEASLQVPYRDDYAALLTDGNLLLRRGGTEAMQIQYVQLTQNAQGEDLIEAHASTLLAWLGRRIVLGQIQSSGWTGQQILRQMHLENVVAPADDNRRIPQTGFYPRADYADEPIADYASEEHASVQDCTESLLSSAKLGFRVVSSPETRTHLLDAYRGRDLTAGQSGNAPCIFSGEFDTLGVHTYLHSTEALKTTAYVYGADRSATVGGSAAGLARRETAVDASDIAAQTTDDEGNEITLSDEQVTSTLAQRGTEELGQALEERTFEGTLPTGTQARFGTDFDVGDRVTCQDRRWGMALDARITETTETWQGSKQELSVTFGEGTPTLRAALRQMMK